MTAKELRLLEVNDLRVKVKELKEDVFWLKFKNKSGQMDKSSTIGETKKDLARALTVLREKTGASGE